jgi:hypothetical protein
MTPNASKFDSTRVQIRFCGPLRAPTNALGGHRGKFIQKSVRRGQIGSLEQLSIDHMEPPAVAQSGC